MMGRSGWRELGWDTASDRFSRLPRPASGPEITRAAASFGQETRRRPALFRLTVAQLEGVTSDRDDARTLAAAAASAVRRSAPSGAGAAGS